jgi:hypothetical protein
VAFHALGHAIPVFVAVYAHTHVTDKVPFRRSNGTVAGFASGPAFQVEKSFQLNDGFCTLALLSFLEGPHLSCLPLPQLLQFRRQSLDGHGMPLLQYFSLGVLFAPDF